MTTDRHGERIPEWSRGDRLRKARSMTGLTVAEFAERIGVSDRTVNVAEGDKRAVRQITLNAWSRATGVSLHWLETGEGDHSDPPPPGPPEGQRDELEQLTAAKRARTRGRDVTGRYFDAA